MRDIIDIYNPHLLLHPPPDHWGVEDEDARWNDTGEEVIEDVDEVGPERSPVSLSFPVIMTPYLVMVSMAAQELLLGMP